MDHPEFNGSLIRMQARCCNYLGLLETVLDEIKRRKENGEKEKRSWGRIYTGDDIKTG